MAKKKLKKSKKKSQKKQRKQPKEEKNELPEVSKELYELQISDLSLKLQRVREQCADLETENVQIKENLTQENADRAEVITYLKRVLKSKSQDIIELQEQITTLQQARDHENTQFYEQLSNREMELKKLQEQLTTEINLLNGKLNVLDEFRVQKEELMKKFELQEEAQKLQERKHQETLHNTEKDFILKKIQMKKEVEERLTQLSEDFQTVIQSKIDSTTRVTAIENDSLKIEMKKLINTCKNLIKENKDLKTRECRIKVMFTMLKEELDQSIRKYINANKKFQQVARENNVLKSEISIDLNDYLVQIEKLSNNLDEYKANLNQQIEINRELNQKLLFHQEGEQTLREKLQLSLSRIERMENVIRQASAVIQEILSDEHGESRTDQQKRRTRFTLCMLEILKTAGIDDKEAHHVTNTSPLEQ